MIKLPDLDELLFYKNTLVIQRFKINHPQDASRAEALFINMLRYLWLCEKHWWDSTSSPDEETLHFIPVMHAEMRSIDNMWHEFILITRDYHDFCFHYFGRFLHHEPNMRETLDYSESQFVSSLNLFLNYVYDVLGEEVIHEWFSEHLDPIA